MQEIKETIGYYRDSLRSYLVIHCPGETAEKSYPYRMLCANRIEGLLPVDRRSFDGESYLYFDITAKVRLTDLMGRGGLTAETALSLLARLIEVQEVLASYLLDAGRILLDPETVYYDPREETWSFAYSPVDLQVGEGKGAFASPEKHSRGPQGQSALLELLALSVEDGKGMESGLLFRLASLAEDPDFMLTGEILESERKRVLGSGEVAGPAPELRPIEEGFPAEKSAGRRLPDDTPETEREMGRETDREALLRQAYAMYGAAPEELSCGGRDSVEFPGAETGEDGSKAWDGRKESHRREGLRPEFRFSFGFLLTALVLFGVLFFVPLAEPHQRYLLILGIAFVSLAVLMTAVGMIRSFIAAREKGEAEEVKASAKASPPAAYEEAMERPVATEPGRTAPRGMPEQEVARFYGIVIKMYFKPKEHDPPHLHAIYADYAGIFDIEGITMTEGDIPPKARGLVEEWIRLHKKELLEMWSTQQIRTLPPLQ